MENHIAVEEKKQDKGFTLVELLIVIVILGILATVTVFAVQGITTRGKETACRADKKTLLTAIEAHMADLGTYPASLAALASAGLLADDGVSANFDYAQTAGSPAIPASNGPDGVAGTPDDIAAVPATAAGYTLTVDPAEDCAGVTI